MTTVSQNPSSPIVDQLLAALSALNPQADAGKYASGTAWKTFDDPEQMGRMFLASLANVGSSITSVRVIVDGRDEHPARFVRSRTGDGLISHSSILDRPLNQYLSEGATVVFDHVNDYVPQAQTIQEFIEAATGCQAWIQCYVTKASKTAFSLHGDDHAFIIAQLYGRKLWKHADNSDELPSEVIYSTGDVSFYPRGTLHDVSGVGELSVHLTIAFEGYSGHPYEELDAETLGPDQLRRVGTGLPYSLDPAIIDRHTPARLAIRHEHLWSVGADNKFEIYTGYSKVRLDARFKPLVQKLLLSPSTTPAEAAEASIVSIEDALSFYRFGFGTGLLFTASRERL